MAEPAAGDSQGPHPAAPLRALRLVGIGAPVLFIVALQLARPFIDERWPQGDVVVSALTALAALGFGAGMFLLIDRSYGVVRQAALREERWQATVTERERIARELHDSLAQVLGTLNLRLRNLKATTGLADDARLDLEDMGDICLEAYRDVRESILGLRDSGPKDRTLLESLDRYVTAFGRRNDIDVDLTSAAPPELSLAPAHEVQVIRIVQEALANARKHSGARRVRVHVDAADAKATFSITDDGRGFDPAGLVEGGFGLQVMRERAESVSGLFRVESRPGDGTRVLVAVPTQAGEAA